MQNLTDYIEMGGHGSFIWASYGMVLVVLLGLWVVSRCYVRASRHELDSLSAKAAHRNPEQTDET